LSLIDEALKRARQEAAQQDAARRGLSPSWTPVPLAPFRERRSPVPVVAGIALALVLAGGFALWLTNRRPAPPQTIAAQPAAATAPAHPTPATRPLAAEPAAAEPRPALKPQDRTARTERAATSAPTRRSDPSEPIAAIPERPRPSRTEPQRRLLDDESASGREAAPPRVATVEPRPTPLPRPAPPARTAETAAPEDGKIYVREAALPGGRKLELRGIAYSDTQPVVLINGKVLAPGEGVEGYTVVAIQPQRVELKGSSGTLYLALQ
jgi:hypothetical protein